MRFYGEIQGHRGLASRMGSAAEGMWGHIRGWHVGADVRCYVGDDGEDVCQVSATGGSSGYGSTVLGNLETLNGHVRFTPSRELRDAILKAEGSRIRRTATPKAVIVR